MCEWQLRSVIQHSPLLKLSIFAETSGGQHQLYSSTYPELKQFCIFCGFYRQRLLSFKGKEWQLRVGGRGDPASLRSESSLLLQEGCPLWSGFEADMGHEAQAGPRAVIKKPSSSGVWGRLGREFPSSQSGWDNAKDSIGQPRRPAAHCYHGKHPQSQEK